MFKVDILDKIYWRKRNEYPVDEVNFDTVGSKMEEVISQAPTFLSSFPTNVFQAEIMAILKATNSQTAGKINIFADSQAGLKPLSSYQNGNGLLSNSTVTLELRGCL